MLPHHPQCYSPLVSSETFLSALRWTLVPDCFVSASLVLSMTVYTCWGGVAHVGGVWVVVSGEVSVLLLSLGP